ncbi:Sacsin [Bienertia sinuspersici]
MQTAKMKNSITNYDLCIPDDEMEAEAKAHIEELRLKKFSIGSKHPNPLTQDLHHAVTCLSAELYTKHVHFLMELIQNAEDNEYEDGVEPTLEFALTTEDITGCGAEETLLVFNNEVGFSRKNMESICSVGRSTKKGMRRKGFIGEKGIGFKSVFLVSKLPHIVSNGYKVKFSEEPDKDCGIGYIVPEWISDESFISKIQNVYGSEVIPTTTIVLPLKTDKVKPVTKELSSLHPELLLFLSKLSRLYVHENSIVPNNVTAISIVSQTNYIVSSDKGATSSIIHLSVKEKPDAPEEKCKYYLWRQSFAVTDQAKVSERADVKEWIVSLAFPFGKRLKRGTSSVGVFAFLPTSMVTKFPFVIQADFILASSRESIVFDSKWNQGILECLPVAFYNAFLSFVNLSSMRRVAWAFEFLPLHASPFPELNKVRETIRMKLCDSMIVPCETFNNHITYCKPSSAVRILPSFREILIKLKETGVSLSGISSTKMCLVHSSLDQDKYGPSLDFLGVYHRYEWYGQCATACNLVSQASDEIYIDILYFFSQIPRHVSISSHLLKFTTGNGGEIELCGSFVSMKEKLQIRYCTQPELHVWLQKCNIQFGRPKLIFFLPDAIQVALIRHPKYKEVSSWLLSYAGVKPISAFEYSSQIRDYILQERRLSDVVAFSHFLYHCKLKKFLKEYEISSIILSMPIIDGSGFVRMQRNETLVTASGSNWVKLFGPNNSFIRENYVDLSEIYAARGEFAAEHTPDKMLLDFLTFHARARDLPEISLPNSSLQVASSLMSSEQAFLLLDWIRFHRTRGASMNMPRKFIESIRCGKWMKTKTGVDSPSKCTIPTENGKAILELMKDVLSDMKSSATSFMEKVRVTPWLKTSLGFRCPSCVILDNQDWACLLNIVSVPVIDEAFYGDGIRLYTDELKEIGVAFEPEDVLKIVVNELKILLSSPAVASEHLLMLLHCIKKLKEIKSFILAGLCECLRKEEILRTRHGHKKPEESILFNSKWASISFFVDLPLIDDSYYGIQIYSLRDELKVLGVLSNLEEGAIYVAKGLTRPIEHGILTAEGTLSLLHCLKILMADEEAHPFLNTFIDNMMRSELLMTSCGHRLPKDSILFQSDWSEKLELTDAPFIHDKYYGIDMSSFLDQLKQIGVKVDVEEVCLALSMALPLISETPPIKRIYCFLKEFHWKPISPESANLQVWIPTKESSKEGMWVDSSICVLHDKAHHFVPILYSLETYYEKELLSFFSNALHVIDCPSTSHYMQIWELWESRDTHEILESECCFFWGYILKNWNQEMVDTLKNKLTKVPALSLDGSILLVSKDDVVVPDDVSLKKMFLGFEDSPLSVWLPKSSLFSIVSPSRLSAVYYALGVRKISECVERSVRIMPSLNQPTEVILRKKLIVKGLIVIILAFLACKLHMPTKERHELINTLLSVSIFDSDENIRISYRLLLRAEKCVEKDIVKLVHWDKKFQRLFINGTFAEYQKASAEFVNCFAAEIAHGLLADHRSSIINDLQNLIQMGFLFEFQEHSIQFLLTKENIEVLVEDEEFLMAAFSEGSYTSGIVKQTSAQQQELFSPLTPSVSQRAKRRRLDNLASDGNEGKSKSSFKQAVYKEKLRKQHQLEHSHQSSVSDEKGPYIKLIGGANKRKKELKEH